MTAVGRPPSGGWTALDGAGRENRVLRDLVTIYHHLTGLALQSADLESVVSLLVQRTGPRAAVVSPTLDVLAAATGPGADPAAGDLVGRRLGRVLHTAAQTRRALRLPPGDGVPALIVAPIVVGDEVVAYLLAEVAESGGEDLSLLVTEHAATICGVILGRERIVAAAAGRVRDDLVEGLLQGRGSPEEIGRWARHLGYDAARSHRVLCLVAEPAPDQQRLLRGLERLVAGRAPDAITSIHERELAVVASEPPALSGLAEACLAEAGRAFPGVVVLAGLGGSCREPGEVAHAYTQARRAVQTAGRLGRRGRVVAFEDLGIHRLLMEVPDARDLRSFADEVLGPLIAHERSHGAGYLRTLAIWFRENGSLQRAARELHVHPNTVTYRIGRVEAMTGLDLTRYRDRLMAQVALEILDALEESP